MAKKDNLQKNTEKIEKEYIIPLRKKFIKTPRYKKTPKAVKSIKEFLLRHMKIRDKDLKKIKIDNYLNDYLWFRGIKNPPAKIKVKAIKEEDKDKKEIIRVYLSELPQKLKFKKLRQEKQEKVFKQKAEDKKSMVEAAQQEKDKAEQENKTQKKDLDSNEKKEDKKENTNQEKQIEKENKSLKQPQQKQKQDNSAKQKKQVAPKRKVMNK